MNRGKKVRLGIIAAILLSGAALWLAGGFGWCIRKCLLPALVPRNIGSSFVVYAFDSGERFEHEKRGITFIVSPERLEEMINGALPLAGKFVPPGLFVHGFNVQCIWMPNGETDSSMGLVPLWVVIDKNCGYQPVIKGRMPLDEVNAYLAEDLEDALTSREKWVFGSYKLIYRISFKSMRILSDSFIEVFDNRRKLTLLADGIVRIKFDDDPVSASTTARIKELRAEVSLQYIPVDEGYALAYNAEVTDLDLNVNNLLRWGDEKVADSLRRSLQKSLNRRKNKERAMRLRIPEWVPRDVILDLQLSQPGENDSAANP